MTENLRLNNVMFAMLYIKFCHVVFLTQGLTDLLNIKSLGS